MGNSENPSGINRINNLTALKFFLIATAIQKNLCLASYSFYLFLERKELIEVPLSKLFSLFLLTLFIFSCAEVNINDNDFGEDITITTDKSIYQKSDTISLLLENHSDFTVIVGKRCNRWLEMTFQEKIDGKWSSDKYFQYMFLKCLTSLDTVHTNYSDTFLLPSDFFEKANTVRFRVPCYIVDKDTSIIVISNLFEIEK